LVAAAPLPVAAVVEATVLSAAVVEATVSLAAVTVATVVGGGGGDSGGGGGGYSGGGGGGWFGPFGSDSGFAGGGGGSIIDSSAIEILAEISGIASPDDSPNGEIIITSIPEPPSFIVQPSLTAAFTSNVTFQVVVQGTAPLSYLWYLNGMPLSDNGHYLGSTETNLTIMDFQPGDIGNYTLVATNYLGSATSAVATINVLNPIITSPPQSQSAVGGDTVTFSVSTTGQQPFNYQWLFNGTNLNGATSNPLILSNVLVNQSGAYSVIVSNMYSAVTSSNATLTVQPMNLTMSGDQTVLIGDSAQFSVEVQGQQPLYYQWLFNGTNLPNTDDNILTLTNVQFDQAGPYSVVVSNYYGMATSAVVNLTVSPLAITNQPQSIVTWPGNSVTFTLTVGGVPPFTYQWLDNSNNFISGNNTNFLVLSNVQASQFGNYSVIVSNDYESVTSSIATLVYSQVAVWGGTAGESTLTNGLTNIIAVAAGSPGYCFALRGGSGTVIGWPQPYPYPYYNSTNFIAIAVAETGVFELKNNGQVFFNSGQISGISNIVAVTPFFT
jgi:Immunoglobulin domain/Immunoglobulin I-set domain